MVEQSKSLEFSREFYNIFKSLTFTKCVLGKNLVFRKVDDIISCTRFDETTKNVFFSLTMDEYSFKFPEDTITFNDFSVFLDACKRQGYGNDPTFKMRRIIDKNGFDIVEIHNNKSSMSYKLYNPDSYPDEMGFLEKFDRSRLDPEMFSFELTNQEIEDIVDICTGKNFKCETFNFALKKNCIVLSFNSAKDLEYKIKIESDKINGFDNINIGEELKFNFGCFDMMSQLGVDYKISVLNLDDNFNVLCSATIKYENQIIESSLVSPSRISND